MRPAARNLLSNYAAYAVSIVSGLVLTPIIIDALGQEGYGVWLFIGSLTIVLRLLDFGITPTVVPVHRFPSRQDAPERDRRLASTMLAVSSSLGLFRSLWAS